MRSKGLQQKELLNTVVRTSIKIKYLLYLPKNYNSRGSSFPLIVFLHGAGERGGNLDHLKKHGIAKNLETAKKFPFVVVSPQCPEDKWWTGNVDTLKVLIDNIKSTYNIDSSRVYLTGLSMGGFGTWALAAKYPDDFAAIAPICGGGEVWLAATGRYNMPIWAFHGAKDNVIPITRSQEMVDVIKAAGGNVRFTVYPKLEHNCWEKAYKNKNLYKWFLKYKKIAKKTAEIE
ncbi:MAG: hypothetical protein A2Y12_05375 [Planctomycetes bacterium GWF2_42_9]|nr:MAG: hypothetical protein A2Y12_05375 [Planctomycetes bacterium GWF2_42_9]